MFPYLGPIIGPLQQIQQFRHKTSPGPSEQLEMSRRASLAYVGNTHLAAFRSDKQILASWSGSRMRRRFDRCERKTSHILNFKQKIKIYPGNMQLIYVQFCSCLDLICSEDRTRWWIVFVLGSPPPTSQHLSISTEDTYLLSLISRPAQPDSLTDGSPVQWAVNITIST